MIAIFHRSCILSSLFLRSATAGLSSYFFSSIIPLTPNIRYFLCVIKALYCNFLTGVCFIDPRVCGFVFHTFSKDYRENCCKRNKCKCDLFQTSCREILDRLPLYTTALLSSLSLSTKYIMRCQTPPCQHKVNALTCTWCALNFKIFVDRITLRERGGK